MTDGDQPTDRSSERNRLRAIPLRANRPARSLSPCSRPGRAARRLHRLPARRPPLPGFQRRAPGREGGRLIAAGGGFCAAPRPADWSVYTLTDWGRDEIEHFAARWTLAFEVATHGDTPKACADAEQERQDLLGAIVPGGARPASAAPPRTSSTTTSGFGWSSLALRLLNTECCFLRVGPFAWRGEYLGWEKHTIRWGLVIVWFLAWAWGRGSLGLGRRRNSEGCRFQGSVRPQRSAFSLALAPGARQAI